MGRYLKEAFFARLVIPALGGVPINALACAGFFILGLAHPGFWLLGLGLEVAYLWGLTANSQFRRWVSNKSLGEAKVRENLQLSELMRLLDSQNLNEARALAQQCSKVRETYRINQTEDSIIETNLAALERLQALHARLLLARQQLNQRGNDDTPQLVREIAELETGLKKPGQPESLRRSQQATLDILQKRLRSAAAREETKAEIESDLKRIISQVELALDNATMQTKPPTISLDLELSSQIIDPTVFNTPAPAASTSTTPPANSLPPLSN
jgi:hypothetical protein